MPALFVTKQVFWWNEPISHIAIDAEATSKLFFWMVSSKNKQPGKMNKLIFWLNGGPGCSSADGFFLETGPLRFVDGKLTLNKGGWHEFATVVFLDQPIGTGLSFTHQQLRGNLGEITTDFVEFLKAFFTVFPDHSQDDLYLAGESYAGTYIPYFSKAILDWNDQANEGDVTFQLKGVAIGNGWIDPQTQYNSYIPYIQEHSIGTPEMLEEVKAQMDVCNEDMRQQNLISYDKCENVVYIVLKHSRTINAAGQQCMNQYDVRLQDNYPQCGLLWPYELPLMKQYLQRQDVLAALHATEAPDPWVECRNRVSMALNGDTSTPATSLLPEILKRVNVLLFSGDKDFICNHIGTENLIANLTWNGATGFGTPLKHTWSVDGQPAGAWTESRNLTYVLLSNASHMAPYDAPLAALDMINRFMELDPTLQNFESSLDPVDGGAGEVESPADTDTPKGPETPGEEKPGDEDPALEDGEGDDADGGDGKEEEEEEEEEKEEEGDDSDNDSDGDDDEDGEKGGEDDGDDEKEDDDDDSDDNDGEQQESQDPTPEHQEEEQDAPDNQQGQKEEEKEEGVDKEGRLPESPDDKNEDSSKSSSGPSGTMMLPLLVLGAGAAFFMYRRRAGRTTTASRDGYGNEWFPLNNHDSSQRLSPSPPSGHRGGYDSPAVDELDELVVESGLRRESFGDDSDDENVHRPRHW
ncbi:Cell death protease [Actinomortierella ambigua]|nr:Cell death protease [Actinomortierella ambigua]